MCAYKTNREKLHEFRKLFKWKWAKRNTYHLLLHIICLAHQRNIIQWVNEAFFTQTFCYCTGNNDVCTHLLIVCTDESSLSHTNAFNIVLRAQCSMKHCILIKYYYRNGNDKLFWFNCSCCFSSLLSSYESCTLHLVCQKEMRFFRI